MKKPGKILISEAAMILNVSTEYVRIMLQREKLNIGTAGKLVVHGRPSGKWTYNISPKLLAEYSGCDIVYELAKIRGVDPSEIELYAPRNI